MKYFVRIILLLIIITPAGSFAYGFGAIKECEEGVKQCHSYKGYPKEYRECVEGVCSGDGRYLEQLQSVQNPVTCTYGLIKCNSIRTNLGAYWECMDDTCGDGSDPAINQAPDCSKSEEQCSIQFNAYRLCMNLVCNNLHGSEYKECNEGVLECKDSLEFYDKCLQTTCYGDTDKYVTDYEHKNRIQSYFDKLPPTTGTLIPPLERRFYGSPAQHYMCRQYNHHITCLSNDILSCRCEDGEYPKLRIKLQSPVTPTDAEKNKEANRKMKNFWDSPYLYKYK